MKFYIDFEATQFANRIISIGCVAETGDSFKTLVKPVTGKVTSFITQLTGITNEMLEEAPTADEAFLNFRDWVKEVSDDKLPIFYAYGNDWDFIDATIKYMENFDAQLFAAGVKGLMIDYSRVVCKYFQRSAISLRSVVAMIEANKDIVQHHDALEDAEWLKLVEQNLEKIPVTAEIPKSNKVRPTKAQPLTTFIISEGPFPEVQFTSISREPERIRNWKNGQRFVWSNISNGQYGSENDWTVKVWNNEHEAYFKDPIDAVYWSLKSRSKSIKKAVDCQSTWIRICRAAEKGTKYGPVFWQIKNKEQEKSNKSEEV